MNLAAHTTTVLTRHFGPDFTKLRYLCAVSGGQDSMVLLNVMAQLIHKSQLEVAHYNHGLRGVESDADERLVCATTSRMGISVHLRKNYRDATPLPTSENVLRQSRLAFFAELKAERAFDVILTAHHAHDQLETFLFRLVRGSGLRGLSAMRTKRQHFLRPFLEVPKSAIAAHARELGIEFREDASNASRKYLRNRIRLDVTPNLLTIAGEFGGTPSFLKRFSATIDELRDAYDELEKQSLRKYRRASVETEFWTRLKEDNFRKWKKPTQRRVLRILLSRLNSETLGRIELENLLEAMAERRSRRTISSCLALRYSCGQFFFQTREQRTRLEEFLQTPVTCDASGWNIPQLGFTVAVSADEFAAPAPITARFFRAGDRVGRHKLKRLLLEARIPAPEREILPLLCGEKSNRVVWFYPTRHPGLKSAAKFPFSFADSLR